MDNNGEVHSIEVHFRWNPVLIRNAYFPWHKTIPNAFQRPAIVGPRVYRWTLHDSTGEVSGAYIGETDDFERRLSAYRISTLRKRETHVRAAFRKCENSGGKVELQFLAFEPNLFRINGTGSAIPILSDHGARLMMEGIALVVASAGKTKVLNKLREDAIAKKIQRFWPENPRLRSVALESWRSFKLSR